MHELNRPSLQSAFDTAAKNMVALLEYATAAAPALSSDVRLLEELSDSVVVLAAARIDSVFVHVVSLGARHKESTLRTHFVAHGHPEASSCNLPTLVKLVRRRVSFEKGARRLSNVFRLMFNCELWPSDAVRDTVLDLVLLRNMLVHNDGTDVDHDGEITADYATQFKRADVLSVSRYGTMAIYRVDRYKALLFVREALTAVVEQLQCLENHLVKDMSWVDPRPLAA